MIVSSMHLFSGRSVRRDAGSYTDLGDPRAPASLVSSSRPLFITDLEGGADSVNARVIPTLCVSRRWWITASDVDLPRAKAWLDAGAEQVVVPAARAELFLQALPRGTVVVDLVDVGDVHAAITRLRGQAGGFRVRFTGDLQALTRWMEAADGAGLCAIGVDSVEQLRFVHAVGVDVELALQGGPVAHDAALAALTPPTDASLPFDDSPDSSDDPYETMTVSFLDSDET